MVFRLEELQQAMVGGEQANNEEVKERIRKKKKYAEERNRKLKGEFVHIVSVEECKESFLTNRNF